MLLSDTQFANKIGSQVVTGWESIRPVPKVHIDFGNGKTLDRTLAGNTVIYLCAPDGMVIDAFPGVYTPADMLATLQPALDWYAANRNSDPMKMADALSEWHLQSASAVIRQEAIRTTMSKAFVESPLLDALGVGGVQVASSGKLMSKDSVRRIFDETDETDGTAEITVGKAAIESPILDRLADIKAITASSSRLVDISKIPTSTEKLKAKFKIDPKDADAARKILVIDSTANVQVVRPFTHMLLGCYSKPLLPSDLTQKIYKDMLHIAIDDPYLGLADYLIPGTGK